MNERLKEIRKALGMTQQEFADHLNVSKNNIVHYELARRNPSASFISLLCTKCGVNEKWILTGEGDMRVPRTDASIAAEIADKYVHINSRTKNEILKLISDMDEDVLKLLVKEARRIVNAVGDAEKDQD